MIEAIENFFLNTVGKELCILFCSMIPIIELRGAIPMGVAFGLPIWEVYLLSVLGNMIPVPFILLLITKILDLMSKSKIGFINKFGGFLVKKAAKNRGKIEKFSFFGVALFVAIPLPVTGAWTGSLVAATIGMKFWRAFFSALIGVLIAGIVVSLITVGVSSVIQLL